MKSILAILVVASVFWHAKTIPAPEESATTAKSVPDPSKASSATQAAPVSGMPDVKTAASGVAGTAQGMVGKLESAGTGAGAQNPLKPMVDVITTAENITNRFIKTSGEGISKMFGFGL